jgi:Arc/MetJ-type ribon-helix-helix transcriptional regulator
MKLSVSLEPPLVAFLTTYQQRHGLKSRSSVLEAALRLLAEREAEAELAAAYAASCRAGRRPGPRGAGHLERRAGA